MISFVYLVMRILIVRPGALGDSLLTFPVIQALRRGCASPFVTLVGNPAALPLALASGLVEETFDYGEPRWSELFSSSGIHTLAGHYPFHRLDLAICWLRDPDGIVERNLLNAGIRRVIVAPGCPAGGQGMHIVDYLAGTVGLANSIDEPFLLALPGKKPEHQRMVAVHPGSGGAQKCWPASSFAAVIDCLWQRRHPVLLLAGPADQKQLKEIERHLAMRSKAEPGMLNIVAGAPLLEVAQRLQECRCYLGNDSGITHLAAILGVPTVALFGYSDPATWRPVGPHVDVIQAPVLDQLPVEAVVERLVQQL